MRATNGEGDALVPNVPSGAGAGSQRHLLEVPDDEGDQAIAAQERRRAAMSHEQIRFLFSIDNMMGNAEVVR